MFYYWHENHSEYLFHYVIICFIMITMNINSLIYEIIVLMVLFELVSHGISKSCPNSDTFSRKLRFN
jgi:hypothetical protein